LSVARVDVVRSSVQLPPLGATNLQRQELGRRDMHIEFSGGE